MATSRQIPKHVVEESGEGGGQGSVWSSEIGEGPSAGTAKWRTWSRAGLAAAEAAPGHGAGHRAGLAGGLRQPSPAPFSREPRRRSVRAPAWEPLRGRALLPGGRYAGAGAAQVRGAGRAQPLRAPAAARALSQPRCLVAGVRATGSPAWLLPAGRPGKLWVSVARVWGQRLSRGALVGKGERWWGRGSGAEPRGAVRGVLPHRRPSAERARGRGVGGRRPGGCRRRTTGTAAARGAGGATCGSVCVCV